MKILNASTRPILDVKVTDVRNEDAADLGWKFDAIGYLDGHPSEARVLTAGDTYKLLIGHVDASGKAVYPGGEDHVTIEFTDAAGLRWRRHHRHHHWARLRVPMPALGIEARSRALLSETEGGDRAPRPHSYPR